MWDFVNNDLKSIVYRYVHSFYTRRVIDEYRDRFQKYWDKYSCSFQYEDSDGRSVIDLNYRQLDDVNDIFIDIYGFSADTMRSYELPESYVYTGIWLPVDYTHKRYTK